MLTSSYYKQVDSILGIVEDCTQEELISAGQRLRNIILDENPDLTLMRLWMQLLALMAPGPSEALPL